MKDSIKRNHPQRIEKKPMDTGIWTNTIKKTRRYEYVEKHNKENSQT